MLKNLLAIEVISFLALAGYYFVLTGKARGQLGLGPPIIALAMPAAGFLLPSIWLIYIACIAAVPLCARNRNQIVPLYLFSLFVMPDLSLPQALGTLKLSSVNTSTCFGLGALIAAFWRGGLRGKPSFFDLPFLAILTVLVVMSSRSTSATNILREILDHTLYFGIPYLVVSRLARTPADFRRIAVALAGAGCLLATLLVAEFVAHWPFFRPMYDNVGLNLGSPLAVKMREGNIRSTGPFIEATAAAFCLTFAVIAASQIRSAFSTKLFHVGVMLLLVAGVIAPQSRGALLGLTVGFAAMYLYRRSQTVIATLLLGAAVLAAFFATVLFQSDANTVAYSQSSETVEYRKRLMSRGVEEFSRSPLTGDSYPSVLERMQDLRQGEGIVDFVNTYLWVALLSGLMGLIPFTAAFAMRLVNLWRIRPRLSRAGFNSQPAAFAFATLIAPLTMLIFTSFGGRIAIMTFVGLALGTAMLSAVKRGREKGRMVLITADARRPQPRPYPDLSNATAASRSNR